MKYEIKIIMLAVLFSFVFMGIFTYTFSFTHETYYVYQVGFYNEEKNKDNKLKELNDLGIQGEFYMFNHQYYVLSIISLDKKDVENQAKSMKGIIKDYNVKKGTTQKELLDMLSKGLL